MARRFIVKESDITIKDENQIEIKGSELKHIQVLRYNIGDEITINEFVYEIMDMKKDKMLVKQLKPVAKRGEPVFELTLFVALLKNEKLDFVIQKATELGVKKIVPFVSQNVIVRLDVSGKQKRQEKLQKIADEACKQCGRTDRVLIENVIDYDEVLEAFKKYQSVIFAYEKENQPISKVIASCKQQKLKEAAMVIGPEGGFDTKEVEKAKKQAHVSCVSLGQRILRADTAALDLIAIMMYEMEGKDD